MPELPEVETVRRHLERRVPGRRVTGVWTSGKALRKPLARGFARTFAGGRFTGIRRIAKFLYLDWEDAKGRDGSSLQAHLGMTGRFVFRGSQVRERPPHTHVVWRFEDGASLLFCDARRFGLLEWVERDARPRGVGIDPTETEVTGELLFRMSRRARVSLKSFLMDQRRVAGLGNIYACEALFRARLSPRRLAKGLTRLEAGRLATAIRDSLAEAVRFRGTTFSDFRDLDDRPGDFGPSLFVYGREGEPCKVCATPIRRLVQAGRSTFYCGGCQRG